MVHVGILVVQFPRNHCGAMNWLLFRGCRYRERFSSTFARAAKKEFTIADETDTLR